MRFGVLGPLLVDDGAGSARPVAGSRQRVLLAALLVRANHVVPADELAEIVWDGAPPAGTGALRMQVMRLRRALNGEAATRIATRDPGYVITLSDEELDVTLFEALYHDAGAAVRAGRWRETASILSEALALWRGAPLLDVDSQVLRDERTPRLEQLHMQAVEWRVDAGMHLGRHEQLLPQLCDLTRRFPLREHICEQQMQPWPADCATLLTGWTSWTPGMRRRTCVRCSPGPIGP
jgi:DNA-binding SARP family transcriptional activator